MGIEFKKLSDFPKGILYRLISDAYSFDCKYENTCKEKWLEDEDFFFNNPRIGDKYCFITTLNDEAIGFIAWDPRNLPEYAIIGDNCIIPKYKGNGYGKLQHDTPCTLSNQIKMLFDAGFAKVKEVWHRKNTGILVAEK